jgi:Gpi18-like mannosyltransferase
MPIGINPDFFSRHGKRAAYWPLAVFIIPIIYWKLLPLESTDIEFFLRPWFYRILEGGFSAMSGDYANYSPPYIYLLGMASIFSALASPIILIKLVSIFFTLFTAAVFGIIVMEITRNRNIAISCACFFPLIPSVAINAAWWGQCDVIYTSFLLCAFLASIKRMPFFVILFFSIAFAFKAQALFIAPYLLYLALKRELPWKYAALVPLVYACMMLPAWLAGRPALELASIYLNQGSFYKALAMHAPNPWALVENYHLLPYKAGVIAGLLATAAVSMALVIKALASKQGEIETKLLLITACLIASPYFLPKMHDRYFFPADVFTILLGTVMPKYRGAALAMQLASLAVYLAFLEGTQSQQDKVAILASAFTSIALMWVLFAPAFSSARASAFNYGREH